jgi:twinkle protein
MAWEFSGFASTATLKGTDFTKKASGMMLSGADEKAFADRGLDLEIASQLGARFEAGKFLFDYRRDGVLLFRKVRTQAKEFWIEPKGQKLQFWGLEEVPVFPSRPSEPLVICEGEFDRIAILQAHGGYALSVPNGASGKRSDGDIVIADDNAFVYLWENEKLVPEVEQFDRVILCTDGDEKGLALRDELALRIGETRCWFVTYPQDCKDANDVLLRHGAAAVKALIDGARPMRPGHLVKPSDIPPRAMAITNSSGWSFLDQHLMLERPELIVVTGEPGHGKGQFIRCLTMHLAETHGWRAAYLTPEDPAHRVKRDMRRFAMREHRFPSQETQRRQIAWIDEHFRISTPPEDEPITIDMVEAEMESAALHHNCQVFVLDPWNEVEHRFNKGEIETQYIERTLRRLLRKMRRLNLILIISAHPTKVNDGDKVSLYKISGSANWKNKCQHGIIIRKQGDHSNVVEVEVEKSKDWETMGKPGAVWMEFNRDRCDYIAVQKSN